MFESGGAHTPTPSKAVYDQFHEAQQLRDQKQNLDLIIESGEKLARSP